MGRGGNSVKSLFVFHDCSVLIETSLRVLCLLIVCARCIELLAHATLAPFQAGEEFWCVCPSQYEWEEHWCLLCIFHLTFLTEFEIFLLRNRLKEEVPSAGMRFLHALVQTFHPLRLSYCYLRHRTVQSLILQSWDSWTDCKFINPFH